MKLLTLNWLQSLVEMFTLYDSGKGSGGDAPDMTALADASKYATDMGKKQFDITTGIKKQEDAAMLPIADQQVRSMDIAGGMSADQYNRYSATGGVAEQALSNIAMGIDAPVNYYEYQPSAPVVWTPTSKLPSEAYAENATAAPTAVPATTAAKTVAATGVKPNTGTEVFFSTFANNPVTNTAAAAKPAAAAGVAKKPAGANELSGIVGDTFYYKTGKNGATKAYHVATDAAGVTTLYDSKGNVAGTYDPAKGATGAKGGNATVLNTYLHSKNAGDPKFDSAVGKMDGNTYFNGGKAYNVQSDGSGRYMITDTAGKVVSAYGYEKVKGTWQPQADGAVFKSAGNAGLMRDYASDAKYYTNKATADQAAADAAAAAPKATLDGNSISYNGNTYTLKATANGYAILDSEGNTVAGTNSQGEVEGDMTLAGAVADAQKDAPKAVAQLKTYDPTVKLKSAEEEAASVASADAEQAVAMQKGSLERSLRNSGVNINSGNYAEAVANQGVNLALGKANAVNTGRRQGKQTFMQGLSAVSATSRGQPGTAIGALGQGTNSANSATNTINTPVQSFNQGSSVAGQILNSGIGGYGNMYQIQNQANLAGANQDGGMWGALGQVAGAAITKKW